MHRRKHRRDARIDPREIKPIKSIIMDDLVNQYRAQIEALQKELAKKDSIIQTITDVLNAHLELEEFKNNNPLNSI
jgi:methionine synthase I (cobalamin-dependent)